MGIDSTLTSDKKLYRIFTVLEALIRNKNNIEKLTYSDLMNLVNINSKKSVREYLFFIENVLGIEIKSKHGKGGGVYIKRDWFKSRYFLKQEEVEVIMKVIEKLEDENDVSIIRKMIVRNLDI